MTPEPLDVSVVVPGGACGVAYTATGVALLLELERAGLARVRAYYTTSAGSVLCAAALCCAPTTAEMLEVGLELFAVVHDRRHTHWPVETIASFADATLPADAHVTCTDRLVIGVTRGARRETVRAYETRDALVRAIVDSCRLPFLTAPGWCVLDRHDGYLAPSPVYDASASVVVTMPYPPAWATLRMTMPVVWWAAWLFTSPYDATTFCEAMHAGVARALARVALAVPVPPEVVARTHAAVDSAQRAFLTKIGPTTISGLKKINEGPH